MIFPGVLDCLVSVASRFILVQFRYRIGRRFLAKMLFHPEMDRHNDGNDGNGAEHQNRKQNLNHHRSSGYQTLERERPIPRIHRHYDFPLRNKPAPGHTRRFAWECRLPSPATLSLFRIAGIRPITWRSDWTPARPEVTSRTRIRCAVSWPWRSARWPESCAQGAGPRGCYRFRACRAFPPQHRTWDKSRSTLDYP
jgi:hypothetical protein